MKYKNMILVYTGVLIILVNTLPTICGYTTPKTAAFPSVGYSTTYEQTIEGMSGTGFLKITYEGWNGTAWQVKWEWYDEDMVLQEEGSYDDIGDTRLLVNEQGFPDFKNDSHTLRAIPSELDSGIGTTYLLTTDGVGDREHTITDEGVMDIDGDEVEFWVLEYEDTDWVQEVWFQKDTGLLLYWYIAEADGGNIAFDLMIENGQVINNDNDDDNDDTEEDNWLDFFGNIAGFPPQWIAVLGICGMLISRKRK